MMGIKVQPQLLLNGHHFQHGSMGTLGMVELLHDLVDSGLFDIGFHNETINTMRGERATIIYFNGKRIYLDLWEYMSPTHTDKIYNSDFDLIIKLQQKNMSPEQYYKCCQRKGLFKAESLESLSRYWAKIVPWTFFPSAMIRNK